MVVFSLSQGIQTVHRQAGALVPLQLGIEAELFRLIDRCELRLKDNSTTTVNPKLLYDNSPIGIKLTIGGQLAFTGFFGGINKGERLISALGPLANRGTIQIGLILHSV